MPAVGDTGVEGGGASQAVAGTGDQTPPCRPPSHSCDPWPRRCAACLQWETTVVAGGGASQDLGLGLGSGSQPLPSPSHSWDPWHRRSAACLQWEGPLLSGHGTGEQLPASPVWWAVRITLHTFAIQLDCQLDAGLDSRVGSLHDSMLDSPLTPHGEGLPPASRKRTSCPKRCCQLVQQKVRQTLHTSTLQLDCQLYYDVDPGLNICTNRDWTHL